MWIRRFFPGMVETILGVDDYVPCSMMMWNDTHCPGKAQVIVLDLKNPRGKEYRVCKRCAEELVSGYGWTRAPWTKEL